MVSSVPTDPFVFLSYSREDKLIVDAVYERLKEAGLNPWMDSPPPPHDPHIDGGAEWRTVIETVMPNAFRVLAFLSRNSLGQGGYVISEFRSALSLRAQRVPGETWLIPLLVDDVPIPQFRVDTVSFADLNCIPFNLADTLDRLVKQLKEAWPPPGRLVTPQQMVIIHSSWRCPKFDQQYGRDVFCFDVKVGANPNVLEEIKSVTWVLPAAWPKSTIKVTDERRPYGFGHRDLAWGDLVVRANVELKQAAPPVHLSAFIRLQDMPPLFPLGYGRAH